MSKRRFAGVTGASLALGLLGCGGPSAVDEASEQVEASRTGEVTSALTQVTGFGGNPGNLRMWKHVPANMPANAPLVVALHGCTQTASGYTLSLIHI